MLGGLWINCSPTCGARRPEHHVSVVPLHQLDRLPTCLGLVAIPQVPDEREYNVVGEMLRTDTLQRDVERRDGLAEAHQHAELGCGVGCQQPDCDLQWV